MTTTDRPTRGRPRAFRIDDALERSMTVFWHNGFNATTTRTLETELGISQSSLYNAFGSKEELFERAISHYQQHLNDEVLSLLDHPNVGRDDLIAFFTAVVSWIGNAEHPGCLVLNTSAESGDDGGRTQAYRARLRELFQPALRSFTADDDDVEARSELLVAAVMGLNISARCGIEVDELHRLSAGITHQIKAW